MRIAVPAEVKNNEFRVAITPAASTTSLPTGTRC